MAPKIKKPLAECVKCHNFIPQARMIQHMLTNCPDDKYYCRYPNCDKSYPLKETYKDHVSLHDPKQVWKHICPRCMKVFESKSSCTRHVRREICLRSEAKKPNKQEKSSKRKSKKKNNNKTAASQNPTAANEPYNDEDERCYEEEYLEFGIGSASSIPKAENAEEDNSTLITDAHQCLNKCVMELVQFQKEHDCKNSNVNMALDYVKNAMGYLEKFCLNNEDHSLIFKLFGDEEVSVEIERQTENTDGNIKVDCEQEWQD